MSIAPTAHRVEGSPLAGRATIIPVTRLRRGDLVFDTDGIEHPIVTVAAGSASTVWIQRSDLTYAEHLAGSILAVSAHRPSQP